MSHTCNSIRIAALFVIIAATFFICHFFLGIATFSHNCHLSQLRLFLWVIFLAITIYKYNYRKLQLWEIFSYMSHNYRKLAKKIKFSCKKTTFLFFIFRNCDFLIMRLILILNSQLPQFFFLLLWGKMSVVPCFVVLRQATSCIVFWFMFSLYNPSQLMWKILHLTSKFWQLYKTTELD